MSKSRAKTKKIFGGFWKLGGHWDHWEDNFCGAMEAEIWLDYEGIEAAGRDYYVSAAREEQEKDREDIEGISQIIDATEMAVGKQNDHFQPEMSGKVL